MVAKSTTSHTSKRKNEQGFAAPIALAVSSSISQLIPTKSIDKKIDINNLKKEYLKEPPSVRFATANPLSLTVASVPLASSIRIASSSVEKQSMGAKLTEKASTNNDDKSSSFSMKFSARPPPKFDLNESPYCLPAPKLLKNCRAGRSCADSNCKPPTDGSDSENGGGNFASDSEDSNDSGTEILTDLGVDDCSSVEDIQDAFKEEEKSVSSSKKSKHNSKIEELKKEDRQKWDAESLKEYAHGNNVLLFYLFIVSYHLLVCHILIGYYLYISRRDII